MPRFYNPKRTRNIYDPESRQPYKLSRSKIDLFLNCPRCFYVDRRLGISQPPGPPFTLNSAVDTLLKKEFDIHRVAGTLHPLLQEHKLDYIPFKHEKMEVWRDALGGGIEYYHEPTNLIIHGGIDDIWTNSKSEIIVVDYKATVKDGEITLDEEWKRAYKRQIEIYQWLFRQNGFKVNNVGFFVYCNGDIARKSFDGRLEFSLKLLPYEGDDSWVEGTIKDAHRCLSGDYMPPISEGCDFCCYNREIEKLQS